MQHSRNPCVEKFATIQGVSTHAQQGFGESLQKTDFKIAIAYLSLAFSFSSFSKHTF